VDVLIKSDLTFTSSTNQFGSEYSYQFIAIPHILAEENEVDEKIK